MGRNLQVEIFCKATLRLALQQISTCSLTHDVSSLEDDNIKYPYKYQSGADPAGGASGARPPKIGENMIFLA